MNELFMMELDHQSLKLKMEQSKLRIFFFLKIKTLIYKKQRTHTLEGLLGLVMIGKEERKVWGRMKG